MEKRDKSPTRQKQRKSFMHLCFVCWTGVARCPKCEEIRCAEYFLALPDFGWDECWKCSRLSHSGFDHKCQDCHDEMVARRSRLLCYLGSELGLSNEVCLLVMKTLPIFELRRCSVCNVLRCESHMTECPYCLEEICLDCSRKCVVHEEESCLDCWSICGNCKSNCCGFCFHETCFYCGHDICDHCALECEKCRNATYFHEGSCKKRHELKHWILYYFALELNLSDLVCRRLCPEFDIDIEEYSYLLTWGKRFHNEPS